MDEYIKREALIENLNKFAPEQYNALVDMIIRKQPVADVVEVVRCRECELFVDNKKALVQYCKRECKNLSVKPYDFCSYGKRKEGADNDR